MALRATGECCAGQSEPCKPVKIPRSPPSTPRAAFRRWQANGVDMTLRHPLEQIDPGGEQGSMSHLAQQDLCFPISENEKDTNTNIS